MRHRSRYQTITFVNPTPNKHFISAPIHMPQKWKQLFHPINKVRAAVVCCAAWSVHYQLSSVSCMQRNDTDICLFFICLSVPLHNNIVEKRCKIQHIYINGQINKLPQALAKANQWKLAPERRREQKPTNKSCLLPKCAWDTSTARVCVLVFFLLATICPSKLNTMIIRTKYSACLFYGRWCAKFKRINWLVWFFVKCSLWQSANSNCWCRVVLKKN